ncbi:hypothetical protein CPC08DRAFT_541417 [Agrocybe pediades]|nr:hypothetical protein CPC08DRAFT_541417 [Agrocybe pediades]
MSPKVIYPLPDHPEFYIIDHPGFLEYRLENKALLGPQNMKSRLRTLVLNAVVFAGLMFTCLHKVLVGIPSS